MTDHESSQEQLIRGVHAVLSFVQTKSARAHEDLDAPETEAERLWSEVHGIEHVQAESPEELSREISNAVAPKFHAAAIVISHLAMRLAAVEGLTFMEVLDRAGQEITDQLESAED